MTEFEIIETNEGGDLLSPSQAAYSRALAEVSALADEVTGIICTDDKAFKQVTSLYAKARGWENLVEARRKELLAPLREKTAEINGIAKKLTEQLDCVRDVCNTKAGLYQKKLAEAAALFDMPEKSLSGEGATLIVRKEKNFRLVDIEQVPARYLRLDESKILSDLKGGVLEIKGLEIYETTTTTLRVSNE